VTTSEEQTDSPGLTRARQDGRTPVTVLTGFLGSGKTTLLNRALSSPVMARTAVVINEFGETGIDHLLTATSNDQIMLLENGCLCCTVFGDLIGTLNRLYYARESGEVAPFDHVVIETSGLADPRPVLQAFLSDPTLEGLYRLGSVVAVVDAINCLGTFDRHDESVRQVALADQILVSKLDMLEGAKAVAREAELRTKLATLNPAAHVHRVDDPSIDPVRLLRATGFSLERGGVEAAAWLNAAAYTHHDHEYGHQGDHQHDIAGGEQSHRHSHADIASFCLVREQPTTLYGLELLLAAVEQNLGPGLLRLKGLVHVVEQPDRPAVIHGAQHLLHNLVWLDRWPDDDRKTRIVFITEGIDRKTLEEMISLLDRVAQRTAAARQRAQANPATRE
jgi:G3E family GTPase